MFCDASVELASSLPDVAGLALLTSILVNEGGGLGRCDWIFIAEHMLCFVSGKSNSKVRAFQKIIDAADFLSGFDVT